MPPFHSLSFLTLVDEMGSVIRCHKVNPSSTISTDGDENDNDVPKFGSRQHVLMEEESLERLVSSMWKAWQM